MGKVARVLAVTIGLIASLMTPGGASDPWVTEHGDTQAKGERAVSLLGSITLGMLVVIGTCAYQEYVHTLGRSLFLTFILLSVPASVGTYVLFDRGIGRRERERAEGVKASTKES